MVVGTPKVPATRRPRIGRPRLRRRFGRRSGQHQTASSLCSIGLGSCFSSSIELMRSTASERPPLLAPTPASPASVRVALRRWCSGSRGARPPGNVVPCFGRRASRADCGPRGVWGITDHRSCGVARPFGVGRGSAPRISRLVSGDRSTNCCRCSWNMARARSLLTETHGVRRHGSQRRVGALWFAERRLTGPRPSLSLTRSLRRILSGPSVVVLASV
jgi:hypothetical protein